MAAKKVNSVCVCDYRVPGVCPDQQPRKSTVPGRFLQIVTNLINRLPPSDRARLRLYCYQLIAATTTLGVARVIRACLPTAATLPIESCPLLAMRFLPTDSPLALLQANTAQGHQITALPRCLPFEQPTTPIPPSPPHSPFYYVSLRSACGNNHRPNTRGNRWVIPARGLLKCF